MRLLDDQRTDLWVGDEVIEDRGKNLFADPRYGGNGLGIEERDGIDDRAVRRVVRAEHQRLEQG